MKKKRAHITYSGTVQGVGFRWMAEDIANSLGLTGWVQNRPDGTVEIACEGSEDNINNFLRKIKVEMGHYIRSADIDWKDYTGDFDKFSIKFFSACDTE